MMKKIIGFMGLFFVSFPLMASCTYDSGPAVIAFNLVNNKILSDPTLRPGAVLGQRTLGGNIVSVPKFSDCAAADLYSISASPAAIEAIGVKGIKGGPVYETGIKGIGYQISELIDGTVKNPVPATMGTISAYRLSYTPVRQMTVWLIKTQENIDTSFTGQQKFTVSFKAGTPSQVAGNGVIPRLLTANITIGNFIYRESSCNINVRGSTTINLSPINLTLLNTLSQGAVTGKQKEFMLDIDCPDSSVGLAHIYWFNPITANSPTDSGVLLNADLPPGGAENVGFIIKQGTTPVEFFDYTKYAFTASKNQSLSFTADYYKIKTPIAVGSVRAMMEIVVQEQ